MEAGTLDWEVGDVGLVGRRGWDVEVRCVTLEIAVDEQAGDLPGSDGAGAQGQVAEADLDAVEVVGGRQLRREPGQDDVEAGVDEGDVGDEAECFLGADDVERGEDAGAMLMGYCTAVHFKALLELAAPAKVGDEREVPSLRRHGAVTDDVTTRLWEDDEHYDYHNPGIDVEKPEYTSPTKKVIQKSPDDGTEGRAKSTSKRRQTNVFSTFGSCREVRDDAVGQSYRAATSSALNAT